MNDDWDNDLPDAVRYTPPTYQKPAAPSDDTWGEWGNSNAESNRNEQSGGRDKRGRDNYGWGNGERKNTWSNSRGGGDKYQSGRYNRDQRGKDRNYRGGDRNNAGGGKDNMEVIQIPTNKVGRVIGNFFNLFYCILMLQKRIIDIFEIIHLQTHIH